MPFFQRKDKFAIPAVEENSSARNELLGSSRSSTATGNSTSPRPSYRSANSNSYVASRDGDPNIRAAPADPYAARDKYHRNAGVGDVYTRAGTDGDAELQKDRNELFSGYNPNKSGSGRFFDGPPGAMRDPPPPGEENEEDVEGIKQQTKFVKQESVNSTRNALRLAREAEETARNTLVRLGDQSEKLANTERHLDVSKGHSQRADDRTDELKQLNRSIFRPVITFNKDAKRAAQDAKIQARYEDERGEREKAMVDVRESQNRIGRAATYGRGDQDGEEGIGGRSMGSGRFRTADQLNARKEQRKRYQFEADEEDDRLEDELDDNLDEIGDAAKRLKALGLAMGQELDTQNTRIERIEGKTVDVDGRLFRNTERLKKIK